MDAKTKILFLASNPKDVTSLNLDEEIRSITTKIRASEHRDALDLISRWAVRPDDLLQELNAHKPTVVHFSGHGSSSGELVLMDDLRQAKTVSPNALKALFSTLRDNVRLVVLNACYSNTQAEAIAQVIDCVIGMNTSIGDNAAITFAASLYRAIGFGRSVKESFEQGKVSLMLESILEEDTPELLVREGVDPASVYLMSPDTGSASSSTVHTARISIRFNRANDFAGGSERAGTIAYSLIRTKAETMGSVPFKVSSEAVDTAEQKLKSLDSLTARTPEEEKEYLHLLRVRDGTSDRLRTFEEALRLALDNEALRNNTFLSLEECLLDFLLGLRDKLFGLGTPILPGIEHEYDWFSEIKQRRHRWWVWWKDDHSISNGIEVDDQELDYAINHSRSGKYNQFPGSESAFEHTAFNLFQLRSETFYRIALPMIAVLIVQQWPRDQSTIIPSAALDMKRWAFSACLPYRTSNALD